MASEDYLTQQKDGIGSVSLHEETKERISQYAADNEMSFSEAVAEIKKAYVTGEFPPGRKRRMKRVTIWIKPGDKQDHLEFMRRIRADRSTASAVIEATLGEML